ncbi:MAG: hypothetical protein M1828_004025 [Chrysothrix sp. TS-e1954]|nr:MAG: hypothetical protein M1828_004025 [Chrysothrix sp. TS-e1954]
MALPNCIGFIGLGQMGYPMAENLCKKTSSTTEILIYDVSQGPLNKLQAAYTNKVRICDNPRQVAEKATCIITMLPESSHVEAVYLEPESGLLSDYSSGHMDQRPLFIDCSTISPQTCLGVRDAVLKRFPPTNNEEPSITSVDAPVSGGVLGAEKGTLTFMVGCSPISQDFAVIKNVLSLMGSSIIPCGGPSLGLVAKLCNNYCSSLIAIATSEAFDIGMSAGIDPRILQRVFNKSIAGSTVNEKWNPVPGLCPNAPSSKGYEGGFRVELMRKDVRLAVEMGEEAINTKPGGVAHDRNMRLGKQGLKIYEEACMQDDCKGKDSRVVYRWMGGSETWRTNVFPDELPDEYKDL